MPRWQGVGGVRHSCGSALAHQMAARRRPFGRDKTLFDYEVDSEAEWEPEEEEGEVLMSEEEGDVEDAASDEEEDGWLVGDDEVRMPT